MSRRPVWSAVCVVVIFCACSDNPLDVHVGNVTEDNYCAKVAEVVCHNMFLCCTGSTIEKTLGLTITTAERECRRDVELACARKNHVVLQAAAEGSAAINRDQASRCLAAYLVEDQGACFLNAPRAPWDEPCAGGLFEGLKSAGVSCTHTVECVEGHYCAADGKCRAQPGRGQSCKDALCRQGHYCDSKERICMDRKARGEACSHSGECEPDHGCREGASGSPRTCGPLALPGAPCVEDSDCKTDYCLPGLCDDGKPCREDSACSAGSCVGGRVCGERYSVVDHCAGSVALAYGN